MTRGRSFSRFRRDRRGAVMVEFAILLPLFAFVLTFMNATANHQIKAMRLEHAVSSTVMVAAEADREGAQRAAANASIDSAFRATFGNAAAERYRLHVQRVRIVGGAPTLVWSSSTGGLDAQARYGMQGGVLLLPATVPLRDGDQLFLVEAEIRNEGAVYAFGTPERSRAVRVFVRNDVAAP